MRTATRDIPFRTPRNSLGQFRAAMEEQNDDSKIILEEFDAFLVRVQKRFEGQEGAPIEMRHSKEEVRRFLAATLGRPITRTSTSLRKGPSSWNGYVSDNFTAKLQAITESQGPSEGDGTPDIVLYVVNV